MMVAMFDHATVKDLYQAYAASLGVFSADLAAEGMTGPTAWLDAWTHSVPKVMDLDKVTDRLGEHWHSSTGGLHFKLPPVMAMSARPEERRVGKEWVSPCISRWSPDH